MTCLTKRETSGNENKYLRGKLVFIPACLQIARCFFLLILFLGVRASIAQVTTVSSPAITTPWVVPSNATKIKVEVWGAGGGGGGQRRRRTSGAGGGGGAYASRIYTNFPSSIPFTVGAGGAGGTNSPTAGQTGGTSSTSSLATNLVATGGAGGTASGGMQVGGAAGSATGGTINTSGVAGTAGTTGNSAVSGAGGAGANGGAGGAARTTAGAGNPGAIAGGGGGGALRLSNGTSSSGGAGASGRVSFTYSNFSISSTTVAAAVCGGSSAAITINSTAVALPAGTYSVTYIFTGANTGTNTTTVTIAGSPVTTGIFSTVVVPNTGSTTCTISKIESAEVGNTIIANNTSTFTVYPILSNNTIGSNQSVCSGSAPAAFTGTTPAGGSGSYTYLWESSITNATSGFTPANGSNNIQTYTAGPVSQPTWFRRTVNSGGCSLVSAAVSITLNSLPAITTQPVAPAAVCQGTGSQSLSVIATGTGLSYSWTKGGIPVTNGGVVSGQGTSTLTLTNPLTANAGLYSVVVSGSCSPSVTSNAVNVIVNGAPSIITQPVSPTATCSGIGTQTLTVLASGFNLSYVWRKNGVAVTNGGGFSGQGTATLTLTNSSTINAGTYDVVVAGTCGPSVISNSVIVTINPTTVITTQPVSPLATCSGSGTQTISVAASGAGLTYTWRKGGTTLVNGGPVNGQGTSALTINSGTAVNAGTYDVVVTGSCGAPVTSVLATVTINTAPVITVQPATPAATCSGAGTQSMTVTATGSGLSYSWRKNGVAVNNGGGFSGQGTPTLTLTNASAANAGIYDVVISGTCTPSVTSNPVTVTINAATAITTQPVSPTLTCSGNGIQTMTVGAAGAGLNYSWRKAGVPLLNGGAVNGQGTNTLTLTNPTAANTGAYTVLVTGTCGNSVTSNTVNVNINTLPAITSQPLTPTATCSGTGTQSISVAASGTGLSYSWRRNGTAVTNGGSISGQGTANLTISNGTTANAGVYDVMVSGFCSPSVTSNPVTVTINPATSITVQTLNPAATCSGNGIQTISVSAVGAGLTYSWRRNGFSLTNNAVVSGQGTNTLTLTNATAANTGFYTVVVGGSCGASVTSNVATVAVNAVTTITGQPVSPAVTCAGTGVRTISVSATGTGLSYSWRKAGIAISNTGIYSGQGTNTLTVTNPLTSDAGAYDVAVLSSCPAVISNPVTVAVNASTLISAAAAPASQSVSINTVPANITLTATGSSLTYQWYSNTVNSNTGGTSVGAGSGGQTASYQPATNIAGIKYYYCVVSGTCGNASSAAVAVTVVNTNTWVGGGTSNFNSAANWSLNMVPNSVNNVVIPAGNIPYPVLSSSLSVNNLTIAPGAMLSVGNNTLTINGAVSGTGTITGSDVSNLVIAGNAGTIYFTGGAKNNYLKNFTLNSGASASLGNALNITGGTSPNNEGTVTVTGTATLTTGGFLTIKSNAFGTARVAAGRTTGGYISGDVTVERFIRQNSSKGWRLLASNTSGQTINQAWQEGQVGANLNHNPGFGIFITKNGTLPAIQAAGFDSISPGASLFKYNPATDNLDAVANTNATQLSAEQGYFLFVRGDRSPNQMGVAAPLTSTSSTTLRSKGSLFQGDQPQQTVLAGQWGCFRNPYASALDLRNVIIGGGMVNAFQVWDPAIGGAFGVGGYQTLNFNGSNYVITPGGGSYGANGSIQNTIESGAAFFVQTSGTNGTLQINESSKTSGSQSVFRPASPLSGTESLAYNLYANNTGSTDMVDGGLVFFDNSFSNEVDLLDVKKSPNFKENLGTTKNNTDLVVERRQSPSMTDTIAFSMYGMRQVTYKLELLASNLNYPGMAAFIVDNYTGSSTSLNLNDTTSYTFAVGAAAASRAAGRLKIVFRPMGVLPVTFTGIRAYTQATNVAVEWKVENQVNISRYEIEKSTNGRSFTRAGIQVASLQNTGPVTYTWLDLYALNTANYYRVKSVSANGRANYSGIVKVIMGKEQPAILVAPNPVVENIVNVQFKNQPRGRYTIRVVNNEGRAVYTTVTQHPGGNSTFSFSLPATTARGVYLLEVIAPDNLKQSLLLYLRN